jgi:transposase
MASLPAVAPQITVGVDSHKDVHVAAAVDQVGRVLGTIWVPTTTRGSAQLLGWATRLGAVQRFGIEGTGSFAAGLSRWLQQRGYQVVEVNRPSRQARRRRGKSDPVDAEAAARAVLAGEATTQPRPPTAPWRCCGCCAWLAARRSRPAARPPTSCIACW